MPITASRPRSLRTTALALTLAVQSVMAIGQTQGGEAGRPQWRYFPASVTAPKGAPNVLLIMTDDVGFGSASTFGGLIPTPVFDMLAERGLRYNQFHTTAMCSPTRAALLTGRNAHAVASGSITNVAIDEAGYTSVIPDSAATIGRVLRDNGYATAFFGKNHNTPLWETGPMGPFDRWPNSWGFDYFYGFNSAAEDQFRPALTENRNAVEPPDDPHYIFDKDMTDHLMHWLRVKQSQKPDNPFFIYLSPGTMHSPHAAPADWVAKFNGKFDMGWDKMRAQIFARQKAIGVIPKSAKLTPRPAALPAWHSLSAEAKRTYARQMEVAAAQLAFFDHQTGRIIDELKATGQYDNTLIIYLQGHNGASMDSRRGAVQELQSLMGIEPTEADLISSWEENGSRHSYSNYNSAWAWAQNAPFPWGKQIASHLGGLRDGLVISWPKRIKAGGEVRGQFHHVIDIAPTIYEAAGVTPPAQVDGVSMVYSFDNAAAPSTRTEQYFEMLGNRSFYKDGWLASTTPGRPPFDRTADPLDPMAFKWELYNLRVDYSQSQDLAAKHPEKLAALRAGFDEAARRYNVYPITADLMGRVGVDKRPSVLSGRNHLVFHAGQTRYPQGSFPSLMPGWDMAAAITLSGRGAQGPVAIIGDEAGGAGLFLDGGRPTFLYNATARESDSFTLSGPALEAGAHQVTVSVKAAPAAGPRAARVAMLVDGQEVAAKDVALYYPVRGSGVVGRWGVRTLVKNLSSPSAQNLAVDRVEFSHDR